VSAWDKADGAVFLQRWVRFCVPKFDKGDETMWIKSIALTNVKSFRERTEIPLSRKANLFVGPNAGGKSNLLEIINWVLRRYILKPYRVQPAPQDGSKDLVQFQDPRQLEKYRGLENKESCVEVTMVVHESDIQNMNAIKRHRSDLERALSNYRNKPIPNLRFVDKWDTAQFTGDQEISFTLSDGELKRGSLDTNKLGDLEKIFYEYLSRLELFLILAKDVTEIDIKPVLFYMSPYRGASGEEVRARLAQDNYYDLLTRTFSATAHTSITPLKLGALRFAAKHRRYEHAAEETPYREFWNDDPEVRIVSNQLEYMGYEWKLRLIDDAHNIYEVALRGQGGELLITQASSGEIELVSFVLGVLGYNLYGGILLIDEPELHLHPRWQGLMRDVLVDLAEHNQIQIIAATHSPIFITPETLSFVHRVARDESGATRVHSFGKENTESQRSLLHIVQSYNNERMFFADRVILVEGLSDRLLFEAFVRYFTRNGSPPEVVEVLEVGGKKNFKKYRSFLERINVPTAIIADLDYVIELSEGKLSRLFENDYKAIENKVLKRKKSEDRASLAQEIERAIQTCDCEKLREIWKYIKSRHRALRNDLTEEERKQLDAFIEEQKQNSVFILRRGEIEHYLPEGQTSLDAIIELTKEESFEEWIKSADKDERVKELCEIVKAILRIDS